MAFPLKDWFDVAKRISREDRDNVEAQMRLYAYKDGMDPYGREANHEVKDLMVAVHRHNTIIPLSLEPPAQRTRW